MSHGNGNGGGQDSGGQNGQPETDSGQPTEEQGQPTGGQPQPTGGQPQPAGAQPAGGQPQGGQPVQHANRRPPAGGGESLVDKLRGPEPKRFILGITGTLAVLAVALFVMVLLISATGGQFTVSDSYDDLNSDQQDMAHENFVGTLVNGIVNFLPLVAVMFVGLAGIVVGIQMNRPRNEVLATAAIASFVGAFVFLVLGVFLVWSQMPSDVSSNSVQTGNLVINGAVIGLAGAIAGAAGAYFGHRE